MGHFDPSDAFAGNGLDLFGWEPTFGWGPRPDRMRAWLNGVLAEARAAEAMPWPPADATLYRTLFPQMTFWLPKEEGTRLRSAFETELARLGAA